MWPENWDPSRRDAGNAHGSLNKTFLNDFKARLLGDSGFSSRDQGRAINRQASLDSTMDQTSQSSDLDPVCCNDAAETSFLSSFYPLSILAALPSFPPPDHARELYPAFTFAFQRYMFYDSIASMDAKIPHFAYAYGCLAMAFLNSPRGKSSVHHISDGHFSTQHSATDYFWVGTKILTLVLEIDNREARVIETTAAGALLETFGILTADCKVWRAVNQFHGYLETIVRRLKLLESPTEPLEVYDTSIQASFKRNSRLMSYIFVVDTLRAIHLGRVPSYSTTELQILLPSGIAKFQDAYLSLRHDRLQDFSFCNEDALLMLGALLSDILVLRRAFDNAPDHEQSSSFAQPSRGSANSYIPFSPLKETRRMQKDLSVALDAWHARFKEMVSNDIISLYFFCRLLLAYSNVLGLPRWANYKPAMGNAGMRAETHKTAKIDSSKISEEALKFSWLILEHVDLKSNDFADSPWMPIILFYAALVVAAKLKSVPSESVGQYGTLRSLSLFRSDLERMAWPCCADMIAAIEVVLGS